MEEERSPIDPLSKPSEANNNKPSNDMALDATPGAAGENATRQIFSAGGNKSIMLNSALTIERSLLQDLLLVALFIILYAALGSTGNLPVYHRRFYLDDETISYPLHSESVSLSALYVIGVLAPALIVAIMGFALRLPRKWMWLLLGAYARTHIFNIFSTLVLKFLVGRPRPEFLKWLCLPDASMCVGNLCTTAACQAKDENIYDGFQSFPSAHASISFAGLSFLSLFLWGVTKPHLTGNLVGIIAAFCPLLTAFFVSITRLQDYKHHWEDVVIGAILGTFWALLFMGLAYLRPPSRY